MILLKLLCIHLAAIWPMIVTATIYDVTKYGADPRGKDRVDAAVKKAIEEASSNGGGTVYFPPGKYLTGPINIKSNIHLHLADGVVVTWSNNKSDYPPMEIKTSETTQQFDHTPLIYSINERNISITGKATLDGQGQFWWEPSQKSQEFPVCGLSLRKPLFMHFLKTKQILLEDITVQNSPFWNVNPFLSEDITIKSINVINPPRSHNTDGINIYSCKNVHISNVTISTGDDCVILKSCRDYPTTNVVVTNSHMMKGHCGVGIGSNTSGGLKNITVTNCIFNGTNRGLLVKSMRGHGGIVENISYSNITMVNIQMEGIVLSMLYNHQHEDVQREPLRDDTPVYRDIHYNGVRGSSLLNSIYFFGLPESPIANIRLDKVDIKSKKHLRVFLNNTKNVVINGKKQQDHFHQFWLDL